MKASLISREVIADSIELVARGHLFDAVVALSGCDKTIPGTVMALARLNLPSLMLYGGSIMPGKFQGRDVTIQDVFEAVGKHASGKMTNAELKDLEDHACPGPGACGGQFTANTMAIAFEFLGISAMGLNGVPAMDSHKDDVAFQCGQMVMDVLKRDLRPKKIITRKSLENAIAAVATTGGSTNAVLHLLAIAREAGVRLSIDDFDKINRKVPLLADLKPGGRFMAADLFAAGGTTLVAKRLLDAGILHADQPTVSGRTIGEEASEAKETPGQEVLRPLSNPIKKTGGLVILKGNLAPDGCVVKVAGHSIMKFSGPAKVFDREEDAFAAVKANQIKAGDVVVIRFEGPSGGPGMREMLGVTAAIVGAGFGDSVALSRRTILRRDTWADGGSRRSGSRQGRTDRRGQKRRSDYLRYRQAALGRRPHTDRDQSALKESKDARAALHDGRDGQICSARVVGVGRRDHHLGEQRGMTMELMGCRGSAHQRL